MKILHVLNHSIPHTDGYCVRSAHIVSAQRDMGWDPVVVTSPQHEPEVREEMESIEGIRYYRCRRVGGGLPFVREFRAMRRLARRVRQIIEIERPDIVHAHSPCLWGAAALLAARRRLSVVYEMRGLWEGESEHERLRLKYRLGRLLETIVARRADAVTAISEPLRLDLTSRGTPAEKTFVVRNGVDTSRFFPHPADAELEERLGLSGTVRLGYVGSLYPFEGVDDLLRSMGSILQQAPQTRLLLIGGGREEALLRDIIRELRLGEYVKFIGRVAHREVARYYSLIDILIYPRKRNRTTELVTPLKPLEAMAQGKTIICSDVGGLRALVPYEAACFYRPGDCEQLAERCLELIRCPEERASLAARAREHVLKNCDWSTVLGAYQSVYEYASHGALRRRGDPVVVA